MSRKIIKIGKLALVTLLIMSMLSSTVFAAQASSVSRLKFRTAVVTQIELKQGSAEVARAQEVIPMYDGMRLSAGDTLRTIGEAVVYIMIDQDKIIRLDANTEAELTNTLLGSKVKITLKKGSMFFNVVEKLTEDESLQFVYGNVTMSVRGTSGSLAGAGTAFGVMLYDGKIEVTGTSQDGKQQEPTQVTPGQKYEVSQSADGNVVEKVTAFTLNEIPKSVVAELAKDASLKERVAGGVPASISPSGAVYVKADQINTDVIGTPDEEAGQFSKEIAQNAGIKEEPKQQQTGSDEPESTVTCQYCGKTMSASTYQAETGHRILLVCGHHVCEAGDHGLAACGKHDKCAAGYTDAQHARTSCGHYACEAGTHELCECGVHYKCQIAEADWTKHVKAACGHCSVDAAVNPKFHTQDTASGKYPCQHPEEFVTCPECGVYVTSADAHKLACGHYSCAAGYVADQHVKAACGTHYKCEAGTHELCDCGLHYKCQIAEADWSKHVQAACGHCAVDAAVNLKFHTQDTSSGKYPCQHSEEFVTCPECGAYVTSADAHKLACGHYSCASNYVAEQHEKASCGTHYKCAIGYTEAGHTSLACGHHACEAGTHELLDCGVHYKCKVAEVDWTKHTKAACGVHCEAETGYVAEGHVKESCDHYLCDGHDHTIEQEGCGHCVYTISLDPQAHQFDEAKECYKCDHLEDYKHCPSCGEYYQRVDNEEWLDPHRVLSCGHKACETGHEAAACGHCTCEVTGHEEAHVENQGGFVCWNGKIMCRQCCQLFTEEEYEAHQICERHTACDEYYHKEACGHCSCEVQSEPGLHVYSETEGKYLCQIPAEEPVTCPKCGEEYGSESDFEDKHIAECGHLICQIESTEKHIHTTNDKLQKYPCQITTNFVTCPDCKHSFTKDEFLRWELLPCGNFRCTDTQVHKWAGCVRHCACQLGDEGEYHLLLNAAKGKTLCLWSVLSDTSEDWRNYVTTGSGSSKKYVSELSDSDMVYCPVCKTSVTKAAFMESHYIWATNDQGKILCLCNGKGDSFDSYSEIPGLYDRTIAKYLISHQRVPVVPTPTTAASVSFGLTTLTPPAPTDNALVEPSLIDEVAEENKDTPESEKPKETGSEGITKITDESSIEVTSESTAESTTAESTAESTVEVATESTAGDSTAATKENETTTNAVTETTTAETTQQTEQQTGSTEQALPENFVPSERSTWPDWLKQLDLVALSKWFKEHFPTYWSDKLNGQNKSE